MHKRLSKSGIEYLDYSWGIWSGCRNLEVGICLVKACWAKGLTSHYPKIYPNGFEPTYYIGALDSPKHLKKPSRISVGWVGDVIGYGLDYKEQIYSTIRACPQHTFLFLTKNADQLIKFSPFPDNCWVGVSATDFRMFHSACYYLDGIEAKVKYISCEPLLDRLPSADEMLKAMPVDWVIIGAQTKPYKPPKIEWVKEIVRACDKAGVKVFLKNSLLKLLPVEEPYWSGLTAKTDEYLTARLKQEMPTGT